MMMLNSFQQFVQQMPVLTMTMETNHSPPFDPLSEIRNGEMFIFVKKISTRIFSSSSQSRIVMASIFSWNNRFYSLTCIQVTILFTILHFIFFFERLLIVFLLANYLHVIDETRLTINYMISSLLYEETLSFPIELICIEIGYLLISIAFEVDSSIKYF